jgi:hypothetical protein
VPMAAIYPFLASRAGESQSVCCNWSLASRTDTYRLPRVNARSASGRHIIILVPVPLWPQLATPQISRHSGFGSSARLQRPNSWARDGKCSAQKVKPRFGTCRRRDGYGPLKTICDATRISLLVSIRCSTQIYATHILARSREGATIRRVAITNFRKLFDQPLGALRSRYCD